MWLAGMNVVVTMFYVTLKITNFIVRPILYLTQKKEVRCLAPIKNDLLKQSAVDLAEKIRTRQIKSEDVVVLFLERCFEVNKILNAVVETRVTAALMEAKAADILVTQHTAEFLQQNYPFLGVPFSVKGSLAVKDLTYSCGFVARAEEKAESDGEVIRLLKESGAIAIAVTNTPELCFSWECYNNLHGTTLNPYNFSRTCGGSSGGEAALVSACGSPFGVGTAFAGSLRVPAAFCGVFGHKPTVGVVSIDSYYPPSDCELFLSFLSVGPLSRYAKDLAPLLKVMSNRNSSLRLDEPISTKDLKIFYKFQIESSLIESMKAVPVDNEIKHIMKRALEYFKINGVTVQEAPIDTNSFLNTGVLLVGETDSPDVMSLAQNGKSDNCFWETIKCIFGKSKYTYPALFLCTLAKTSKLIPKKVFEKNQEEFKKIREDFLEMLGTDGVFIFPTFSTTAFRHFASLPNFAALVYCQIFNALGFPATHIPMGLNKDGMPIGFQVVSAYNNDRLCFHIAQEMEQVFGGWVSP